MKKALILLMISVVCIFNSCSRQEKMNAEIFLERFMGISDSSLVVEEKFNYNGKDIIFLKDSSGAEFVCELNSDEFGNVKKICLAGNKTDKADMMKHYCGLIINTYAPSEDAKAVLSNLLKNTFNYFDTQWYRYSSVSSDNGWFFSMENIRYLTESDAELTLKQNDITFP